MTDTQAQEPTIAAVVLAAGASSRMGQPKLLLPLDGQPVVTHVARAVVASTAHPIVVVVNQETGTRLTPHVPEPCRVVVNPDARAGMATSLRAGLAAAQVDAPQLGGILVVLADQPLVRAAQLRRLVDHARIAPADLLASAYEGTRGTPVYFPRDYFAEIEALRGDEGGRSILARHVDALTLIGLGPSALALDLDVPQDFERIKGLWRA